MHMHNEAAPLFSPPRKDLGKPQTTNAIQKKQTTNAATNTGANKTN